MKLGDTAKRLCCVFTVLAMVLVLLPMLVPSAHAALSDANIGVSKSGTTTSYTENGNEISATTKTGTFDFNGDKNYTITLTNNSGAEATLSFVYTVSWSGRESYNKSVKYYSSGTETTATNVSLASGDTFKQTLQTGGKVEIYALAGNGCTVTTKLSDITLKVKTTASVSFVPDAVVSYTVGYVDGNGAAQTASVTAGGTSNVTVEAELSEGITITPASGYICESAAGSISGTVYVDKNGKFTFGKNETVTPAFLSSSTVKPFTHLGVSKSYATLGAAVNAGSGTVVLNQEYTLPAGNYTIPYGVTLLIPSDDANTVYTTQPGDEGPDTYVAPTIYRKLTMAEGAKITVNGAISLGGKIGTNMTGFTNGAPSGPLGYIQMNSGSSITVAGGGNLYAWGFITGSGSVTINSGGNVYENMQIRDWRGGGATTSVLDDKDTYRVFPFSQYYIQNIEVPLTLKAGATQNVCTAVSYSYGFGSAISKQNAVYLGSNSGLIRLSSGSLTRTYDGSTDRIIYDLNGDIKFANLNISLTIAALARVSIDSQDYIMPINSNMTLNINSGAVTLNQDMTLLPGAILNIAKDASVTLGSGNSLYVYDADEWGGYAGALNTKLTPVLYAPGRTGTRTEADLKDTKIVVNGTLNAEKGYLYTTASGANITSAGNGVVKIAKGTGKLYQIVQVYNVAEIESYPEIPITPAQLKHGDGTYAITANSTPNPNTYTYTDGKWVCTTHTEEESIQTPAACETAGVKTVTCKVCGTTRTEEIPALTHKDENPKDHICDNNCGKSDMGTHADGDDNDHLCDYCNGTVEGDVCVDNNKDHNCDECGTPISVCVDEGKDHKCDICGKNVGIHEAAQGTHICAYCNQKASECTFTVRGDIVTEANCVTNAVYKAKCSVCGTVSETKTITGEVDSSKHTGNTDVRNAKSATCAAEGYTGDTHCSDCNVKLKDGTATEKLTTHTYPETWTQTKAPTCTEKGSEERKCTVDGCDATETREVKELDHDWATTLTRGETTHWYGCSRCDAKNGEATHDYKWEVTKEATCYQDGSKSGTCSCGATATEVIDATGEHTYSETYTTENGNHWRACTTTGCTEKTDVGTCSDATTDSNHNCDVCGKENVTSHEYDKKVVTDAYKATDATCSAKATYYYSCNCGEKGTETFENGEMLDHSFGDWTTVTAATCMAVGEQRRNCEHCEHYETAEIAKDTTVHTGNNTTGVNAKAATCTEAGYTGDTLCECGVTVEHGEDIPATGHKNTETVGYVAATCGAAGYTGDKFCNDCQTTIATGEVIQATGDHIYTWTTTATATCVAKGVETGTCSCGATTTRDIEINPNAHNLVTVEAKTATCTQSGWNAYEYCDREGCRYTTYVEIPATNSHSDSETDNDHICDTCDKVMTECSGGTASCTKKAVCTTCGEEYGELADHSYTTKASTSVKSEATCKDVAVYWAQCDNCTAVSETVTVNGTEKAPDNHVGGTEAIPEVPATCQTAGTTAGTKCLGCNTVISGCTEIAKQACADTDSDHICNNGCDQKLSECADNDTDHDCDVCGAAMGTHEAAEGKHTCDYCGETVTQCDDSDDADHYCDVCGEVVGSHTYGTEWKYDTTSHWHECACGEKSDLANHSYDDGVVTKEPTTEAEGEMTYTCKCGYSYTETIDKLVPQGYTVKIVNYTANDANLATVTIDGNAVEYQKKVAVEAKLGVDGAFAVSCKWGCLVAYSTDGTNFEYLPATKDETADSTYNFFVPQIENVQIHVLHKGDANKNGTVNATDLSMLKKYMLNDTLSGLVEKLGDANGNGITNATDLSMLKKLLLTEAYLTKW